MPLHHADDTEINKDASTKIKDACAEIKDACAGNACISALQDGIHVLPVHLSLTSAHTPRSFRIHISVQLINIHHAVIVESIGQSFILCCGDNLCK